MQIPEIPSNMRIIQVGGRTFQQKIRRSRKKFKLPLATRKKMATSARKFKFPVLTAGALASGLEQPIRYACKGMWTHASQQLSMNYLGFDAIGMTWTPKRLFRGT